MKYFDEVKRSMEWLGSKPETIFLGQNVLFPGTVVRKTLIDVPDEKKIELPVFEEVQMGISTGLALEGYVPITIYPRLNFLLLAVNQIVNHLDKIEEISKGGYKPKVIIKSFVGSIRPLHPGVQHSGDFTEAFRKLVRNIDVVSLLEPEEIFPAYEHAYNRTDGRSTLIIEHGDFYNEK